MCQRGDLSFYFFLHVACHICCVLLQAEQQGEQTAYLAPADALWLMTGFPEADAHTGEGGEASGGAHGAGREQELQQEA